MSVLEVSLCIIFIFLVIMAWALLLIVAYDTSDPNVDLESQGDPEVWLDTTPPKNTAVFDRIFGDAYPVTRRIY